MQEEKPQSNKSSSLRVLRTYKDDLAQAMTEDGTSIVSIVSAENKRRVNNKSSTKNTTPEQKQYFKKIGIVILSTVLVILGAGSALYFYGKSSVDIVIPKAKISSIVFADNEKGFDITDLSRRQILNELTVVNNKSQITLNRIKNIFITKSSLDEEGLQKISLVSAKDFLNAIDVSAPASFLRSLNPAFMMGIHAFNGNQPFIILQTSFYENAFSGMLEWERYMKDDLAPLFGPAETSISAQSVGTSTLRVAPRTFNDVVVKNQDTRVLKSLDGKVVLIYSFIDKNTIVITTNEDTFGEIFTRYTSSRSK